MNASQQEFMALFSLLKIKGVGIGIAQKLIDKFGSAHQVYQENASELKKVLQQKSSIIKEITEKKYFSNAEQELQWMQQNQVQYVLRSDSEYPQLLKNCNDAPLILYYKGKPYWNERNNIAIVGTRKATRYGLDIVQELVENFSQLRVNLISGLALGVDIEMHKTAIEKGVCNFGILAHGLDQIYPRGHKKYLAPIFENGAVLSEYSTQDKFNKENFIQRNRIIAGMSSTTLIIESQFGGGAMTTARFAFNYDRDVYAVPGKTTDENSMGCNFLIKNLQAQLLLHPQEVFQWFGKKRPSPPKELFLDLNEEESRILQLLEKVEKIQIDEMALQLQLPTYQLLPLLLNLEFKEIIQALPGKYYCLK